MSPETLSFENGENENSPREIKIENEESERFFKQIDTTSKDIEFTADREASEYLKNCRIYVLAEGAGFSDEQTEQLKNLFEKIEPERSRFEVPMYLGTYVGFSFPDSPDTLNLCLRGTHKTYYSSIWYFLRKKFGYNLILRGAGDHKIMCDKHITETNPGLPGKVWERDILEDLSRYISSGDLEKRIKAREEQFETFRTQLLDMNLGIISWDENMDYLKAMGYYKGYHK